jgi:Tfp pilus assembly protein PilO
MGDIVQFAAVMMVLIAMPLGIIFVGGPLAKGVARRLEGKGAIDPALLAELDELRAQVADLQALPAQLSELQERVDFAERLLGQAREPERLPGTLH